MLELPNAGALFTGILLACAFSRGLSWCLIALLTQAKYSQAVKTPLRDIFSVVKLLDVM